MHRCCITGKRFFINKADRGRENTKMFGYISRNRALWYILSHYLYGELKVLCDAPSNKTIRGLGINDTEYNKELSALFDYKNYQIHTTSSFTTLTPEEQSHKIDLYNINFYIHNNYDFITCSEIVSHISPYPGLAVAFKNLHSMLRPGGILVLSTPYMKGGEYKERHPSLHSYEVIKPSSPHGTSAAWMIKNKTADGADEIIPPTVIYNSEDPASIEMRIMNDAELERLLSDAGFTKISFKQIDEHMNYNGIHWDRGNDDENSLFIVAFKN